jgi:Phasin protein
MKSGRRFGTLEFLHGGYGKGDVMAAKKTDRDTAANPALMAGIPVPEGFEGLVQANAKATEIWLESWTKLAGESARFVTQRLEQDMDLLAKMRACRSPLELLQLQSAFMQRALVDYMQEAGKLADMETAAGVSEIEAVDRGVRQASKAQGKTGS